MGGGPNCAVCLLTSISRVNDHLHTPRDVLRRLAVVVAVAQQAAWGRAVLGYRAGVGGIRLLGVV